MSPGTTIIVAILTSNAFFGVIQFLITRAFNSRDLICADMSVVIYNQLADKIEKSLDRGYATPEQRRDVEKLYERYDAHGWNGDMRSRMDKFYDLPTKNLNDVYQ